MFVSGVFLGVAWGLIFIFGENPLSDRNSVVMGKLLWTLFSASAGINCMLAYRNYKASRRLRREGIEYRG